MAAPDLITQRTFDAAIETFRSQKTLAESAIAQLNDEQLRRAPDANTSSVAVIMKHMAGNLLSRFTDFLTTDGEKPWRDRDSEFIDDFTDRAAVMAYWEKGWACLFATLASLEPSDLARTITIRAQPQSVPLALARALAHAGYHTGQIVLTARLLAGDTWNTITVPRGKSAEFNRSMGYEPGPGDRRG